MRDTGVTAWNSVPALMHMLTEYAEGIASPLPDSLRLVLLSGDRIPLGLPAAIRARAPQAAIVSLGGATEASIWSILYPVDEVAPDWNSIPYGRPMRNQTFHVLDAEMRERPEWVPGELYIGGTGLAKGYWKDDERTRERFVRHPRSGEQLYRTGDMGRFLPEGVIEFLGREDLQIKLRGYRIELGEIESLLRQHEQVREAVVVLSGNSDTDRQLNAFVLAHDTTSNDLMAFVRRKLPGYMVPSHITILQQLPISSNGKVDRKALEYMAPDAAAPCRTDSPSFFSRMERRVAAVWEEVLGRTISDTENNFFDLGGTSVLAVRLHQRLMTSLDETFPLVSVFEYPTIQAFSRFMEKRVRKEGQKSDSNRIQRRSMRFGTGKGLSDHAATSGKRRRDNEKK